MVCLDEAGSGGRWVLGLDFWFFKRGGSLHGRWYLEGGKRQQLWQVEGQQARRLKCRQVGGGRQLDRKEFTMETRRAVSIPPIWIREDIKEEQGVKSR